MNATVLSGNLHRAVYDAVHPLNENGKRVTRCSVTRCKGSSLPVLNHVLITDHEGRIAVYSHDLETPAVAYAPARIDEPFAICAPAHVLLDWLDIIKKDNCRVDLTFDRSSCLLIIRADNARATFKGIDAAEFPPVTEARENGEKDPTLAGVGLAVSKDDARPQFHKVCHRDGLMIGSDGFRMHLAPSPKTDIPEGFPDVSSILDSLKSPTNTLIVPAVTLMKAVKSLKATAKQGSGWILFHSNGTLTLSAETEAGDRSSTSAEILNSTGEMEFSLQVSYVLDALTHVCPRSKNAKRAGLIPQTVTIYTTPQKDVMGTPGPVWFVNGELKAAIMQRWDRSVPEDTAKPTKSELMSTYNRLRAELRRSGQDWQIRELNQAFGDLQRKSWQEDAPKSNRTWALLAAIVKARAERVANLPHCCIPGFSEHVTLHDGPALYCATHGAELVIRLYDEMINVTTVS